VEMEDGGWDGNLIVGEGIHLEKETNLPVESAGILERSTAGPDKNWKLSYNSGEADSAFEA